MNIHILPNALEYSFQNLVVLALLLKAVQLKPARQQEGYVHMDPKATAEKFRAESIPIQRRAVGIEAQM